MCTGMSDMGPVERELWAAIAPVRSESDTDLWVILMMASRRLNHQTWRMFFDCDVRPVTEPDVWSEAIEAAHELGL